VLPGSGGGAMLPITGGTLQGPLILAADPLPTAPLGAATKQYADAGVAAAEHNVGRNLLHNGQMNIWQRGPGVFSANGYTADRWVLLLVLDTCSVARNAFSPGGLGGNQEDAKFVLTNTFNGNAGATAMTSVAQYIEDVSRLSNKTVTVSFFASVNSGTATKLGVSIDQYFGTGGSPSAGVGPNGQAVTLTAGYAQYSLTFTLPSILGKVLGTNGDHSTNLRFWYSAGANHAGQAANIGVQSGSISIYGIQLELGSTATPLEKLDPRVDLANCQRFYQAGINFNLNGYNTAGANLSYTMVLPVPMRASPTVTTSGVGSANMTTPNVSAGNYINTTVLQVAGGVTASGAAFFNGIAQASADL
jgi:hypothetical protein